MQQNATEYGARATEYGACVAEHGACAAEHDAAECSAGAGADIQGSGAQIRGSDARILGSGCQILGSGRTRTCAIPVSHTQSHAVRQNVTRQRATRSHTPTLSEVLVQQNATEYGASAPECGACTAE